MQAKVTNRIKRTSKKLEQPIWKDFPPATVDSVSSSEITDELKRVVDIQSFCKSTSEKLEKGDVERRELFVSIAGPIYYLERYEALLRELEQERLKIKAEDEAKLRNTKKNNLYQLDVERIRRRTV